MDNSEVNFSGAVQPTSPLENAANSLPKEERKTISSKKRSKLPLIIILIIVLLAAAAFIVYYFFLSPKTNLTQQQLNFGELYENSDYLADAFEKTQEYIDSASSDEEKSNRYYEAAVEIFDTCSDQQICTSTALENLEKAFDLRPTADIAWRLYDYYRFLGDSEKSNFYLNIFDEGIYE